jgi:hypothetical protein
LGERRFTIPNNVSIIVVDKVTHVLAEMIMAKLPDFLFELVEGPSIEGPGRQL